MPPESGDVDDVVPAVTGFAIERDALDALLGDVLAPTPVAHDATSSTEDASPFGLAEECLRAGLYERASAAVSAALARGADRAAGLVLLADAFAAQGFFGEALERYQEARLADPAALRARLGELRMLRDGTPRRRARRRRLVRARPPGTRRGARAAGACARRRRRPRGRARGGRPRRGVRGRCGRVDARCAHAWRALGDHDAEVEACRRGLALAPDRWRLRLTLARALDAAGDVAAAEATLAPLAASGHAGHTLVEPCVELAALRARAGDARAARALLVDVLAADALHLDALAQLGALLLDEGRTADAAVAARRVLRFEPEHALALAVDGELIARAGDVPDALTRWRRAVELEPASEGASRARRGMITHAPVQP